MSSNKKGKISSCETAGCGHHCCEFNQGNYIVLYPGELSAAEAAGQSTAHLKIIDADYNGGMKAVCVAQHTASCDSGYKPLDCVSYPFFPVVDPDTDEMTGFIKGKKCPLQIQHLQKHWLLVQAEWDKVIGQNPDVADWLSKIELVGYTEPTRRDRKAVPWPAMPKRAVA